MIPFSITATTASTSCTSSSQIQNNSTEHVNELQTCVYKEAMYRCLYYDIIVSTVAFNIYLIKAARKNYEPDTTIHRAVDQNPRDVFHLSRPNYYYVNVVWVVQLYRLNDQHKHYESHIDIS